MKKITNQKAISEAKHYMNVYAMIAGNEAWNEGHIITEAPKPLVWGW